MIKFLERNWFKILIVLVFTVGIVIVYQSCRDNEDQKEIDANDMIIEELIEKNEKLEDVATKSNEKAKKWEARAKEKEELIIARDLEIKALKEKQKEVFAVVMELPPSELVAETQEILDCAEIELFYFYPTEPKVLFSENCARKNLTELVSFSLVKRERGLIEMSLIDCQAGWTFQKYATLNLWLSVRTLGFQAMNFRTIVKKQDENFSLLEKQKKRSWLNGATKGFLVGIGLAIIINLARGR